jgi:hypothetical protein
MVIYYGILWYWDSTRAWYVPYSIPWWFDGEFAGIDLIMCFSQENIDINK